MEFHPSSSMSKRRCRTWNYGNFFVPCVCSCFQSVTLLDVRKMVCVDVNPTVGTPFLKGTVALVPIVIPNNMSQVEFAEPSPSFVNTKCCGYTFGVAVKATPDKKKSAQNARTSVLTSIVIVKLEVQYFEGKTNIV